MDHTWKDSRLHRYVSDDEIMFKRCIHCGALALEVSWFDRGPDLDGGARAGYATRQSDIVFLKGSKYCEVSTY